MCGSPRQVGAPPVGMKRKRATRPSIVLRARIVRRSGRRRRRESRHRSVNGRRPPSSRRQLQPPSSRAALTDGRGLQDPHAERPRPLEQQPVEVPAVDRSGPARAGPRVLRAPLPTSPVRCGTREGSRFDGARARRSFRAAAARRGSATRRDGVAGNDARSTSTDIVAELGHARGKGAAGRPAADDADGAHRTSDRQMPTARSTSGDRRR